jgi:chemotaxis protein methyltransferase CheR
MTRARALDTAQLERMLSHVAAWTGFDELAIHRDALVRALAPLLEAGASAGSLLERAAAGDPGLVDRLSQAAAVGESYFFRQPEHFLFVRTCLVPGWLQADRPVRVWSAGCSSGEEAWSLAALLEASGVRRFQVLGTDLVAKNVAAAREGAYGPWSVRPGSPLLCDPFDPAASAPERRRVSPALRARTEFRVHNLLSAPPEPARFDLVFCRNVLIYFSARAAQRVCDTLASALSPGAALVFAAMDVASPPPGLSRVGAPEQQIFVRSDAGGRAPRAAATAPPPRRSRPCPSITAPAPSPSPERARRAAPPPPLADLEPVALHLRALGLIERGERSAADRLLGDLRRRAPGYVPGLLESALFCARDGRKSVAKGLMRAVLDRVFPLPADQPVAGPEPLPARFYAATAQAFLDAETQR